jgi:hypothetical protein
MLGPERPELRCHPTGRCTYRPSVIYCLSLNFSLSLLSLSLSLALFSLLPPASASSSLAMSQGKRLESLCANSPTSSPTTWLFLGRCPLYATSHWQTPPAPVCVCVCVCVCVSVCLLITTRVHPSMYDLYVCMYIIASPLIHTNRHTHKQTYMYMYLLYIYSCFVRVCACI